MLTAGQKLGPYQIVSQLGAGGMGEVYRARDTRLDRIVAIKVLNSSLSVNADMKVRFDREAKTISQLNHPNICTLFDVGHDEGTDFLVMEYLEGESLAERLRKGALPLEQALKIGCEIADALERAHRAGIVHRDLKPGNVMLTRAGAKLLDFGLAKPLAARAAAGGGSAPLLSATVTIASPSPLHSPLTEQGALVGTVQYMSPEQIQGFEADARSDIFAFGALLYEMSTGKRAFEGKSQIKVASAILEGEPVPPRSLQPALPPALELVIRTCLAKDPENRYASAHDIKLQLRELGQTRPPQGTAAPPVRSGQAGWFAAAAMGLILIALGVWIANSSRGNASRAVLAYVPAQVNSRIAAFGFTNGPVAVSPDGTRMVFSAIDAGGTLKMWLRPVNVREVTAIPGSEGAISPFWSPDSQTVGFFADAKLRTVKLATGATSVLTDVPPVSAPRTYGAAWGADGTIVFTGAGAGLSRIAESGGAPAAMTHLKSDDLWASNPVMLPDSKRVLYEVFDRNGHSRLELASMSTGETKVVAENATHPALANGFLLFVRDGKVWAQKFDPASGKVSGSATVLLEASTFSAGGDVIAFQTSSQDAHLEWFDLEGKSLGTVGPVGSYVAPKMSPDGKQVLAVAGSAGSEDLYSLPVAGGISTRLTFDPGRAFWGAWSPDGKYIAYSRGNLLKAEVLRKPADGSGKEEMVATFGDQEFYSGRVTDWSPDGQYIAVDVFNQKAARDENWAVPLSGNRKPFQAVAVPASQFDGRFSPDGRWLAYFSLESGRPEVYVVRFPGPGGKYQISHDGGWALRWSKNNELFFLTAGNRLMKADLAMNGESVQVKALRQLFTLPILDTRAPLFDISADGKRVLAVTPAGAESNSIGLLVNWTAELKK